MKDPEEYEREAFVDRINEIKVLIQENLKLYEEAAASTDSGDYYLCDETLREIQHLRTTLEMFEAEYEIYKRWKKSKQIDK